ncbi:unnamed protein product (macronuclear) [Paramecium tetraurelia]|uniref:Uncharacterized protein n=1 Tax=Paramecium tetraurelia TaxID=5888 RepID=A0CE24_PARTE|nr:uncharacterized protein GSPATT00007253001 [Paramecium tetraurelia]CAK69041.1 unnamed protein product [Paramecium tetraurelia]|eukprot:XP_001436438.1 hypothetical protein (macronuclear) [Paramecium tetraurelia strain d4-2]
MRRQISKKDYTIKCEIVLNKISNSRSFNILQVQNDEIEQPRGLTRRKSCYSQLFGYMNKFQNRYHNILPELKTKYCTQDKETKETYRRQTQIAEDTVIRKFRRGLQELTKCQTVIQTLKMLKTKNRNIQNFIKQMRTPNDKIVQEKTRRNSCFCSECGSQSQFQLTHQNDPYFNYFNYNEFLKRKIIDPKINRFKNKLLTHIQLENMKKSFVNENKSQINKYRTVSRTTNLLLKLSSTKLSNFDQRQFSIQSKRVKTEFTQCSPKSFKQYSSQTTKQRKFVTYSNYQSMVTNQTKDSFKSLASIYK